MGTASKLVAAVISPFANFITSVAEDISTLNEAERMKELTKPTAEETREAMEIIMAKRNKQNR